MRVLLLFLDGVGIGPADPSRNPFLRARLPRLRALLDDLLPAGDVAPHRAARATLVPLDAGLGVAGLPQSGTGQTALLTGENGPRLHGSHFGPWVPTGLRELLRTRSVLARSRAAGRVVAFANAYPEELLAAPTPGARRPQFLRAGPPLAALGAELLVRHTAALRSGDAIASEIVNEGWRERLDRTDLPVISPEQAGANLARITAGHDLTLFAHYCTDAAGHERDMAAAVAALETVDRFLDGLLGGLADDVLLVVASDHGNIEDVSAGHTLHPALCIVAGPEHARRAGTLRSLLDVTPMILDALGVA
ncbi:MAG TPA: alkaline phosphatase family protein [Longimicrobiales bacterium]|nr:alkaline phosphatase family protein [Longimicrobiales bacterium]